MINNYDETRCQVLDLIDSLYPDHECIILTGSTLEPLYHRPQSDIDVVVVSKEFTGTTSHVLRHRQKTIDITRVGYFQLPAMLIESCYNSTAILLTMLATGKILRDRNGLGATLITYARKLSTMGNLSYRSDAYSLTRSLVKLKKHLGKRLDRSIRYRAIRLLQHSVVRNICKKRSGNRSGIFAYFRLRRIEADLCRYMLSRIGGIGIRFSAR